MEDFKKHPFFVGIAWDDIRTSQPPFVPEFSSPTDTRNFDPIEDDDNNRHYHVRLASPANLTD